MVAVPKTIPETIPVLIPTVATVVVLLVQVPPPPSLNADALPIQTIALPVIADGAETTVTVAVAIQPDGSV